MCMRAETYKIIDDKSLRKMIKDSKISEEILESALHILKMEEKFSPYNMENLSKKNIEIIRKGSYGLSMEAVDLPEKIVSGVLRFLENVPFQVTYIEAAKTKDPQFKYYLDVSHLGISTVNNVYPGERIITGLSSYIQKTEVQHFLNEYLTTENKKNKINENLNDSKIFNYINEKYYLNGKIINPNKNTLYYVLFNSTYQLEPDGGEILYSRLKKYLIDNKISYKKDSKNIKFWESNLKEIKNQVQNNLCGGKGILKLVSVTKYLKDDQKERIFTSIKENKKYRFDNTI